jgi:hypothetical protein
MSNYRFYFLDTEDRTVEVHENAECESDAAAEIHGVKLLGMQEKYPCIEIWRTAQLVSRHSLASPPKE